MLTVVLVILDIIGDSPFENDGVIRGDIASALIQANQYGETRTDAGSRVHVV